MSGVNVAVDSNDFSVVCTSVKSIVAFSKVDPAIVLVDDCAVVGSSVTPVVDGSVSSVESSSDESSVNAVGLFVTLVDISDVNGVVNSSSVVESVTFTVVSSKVDTTIVLVDDCAVVGSSVTPVVDGSVSSVETSSDESSVNAVGLFVTLVDISDVNGVVNSSSVTFTVVSSKVDTAIIIVDDCAVVGSSVTPVVDGSVSSVETSSDESSVNAVGLFVTLVDISDVNGVVNSSSVVESVKSTVVSSKLDTAVIPVVGCVVVGSSVTPVVDGSVSSVESSSDESSVNAVGLFVTLVDISDVNGVVNSSSVKFTVVSSKVDTAIALVDDCAVVGSSVTPVVDGSVSSVESSSDESSVNAVGLFVTLVDISDVNGVVNSSSVTFTVVSSKVDTAIIIVDDCAVVGSSVTPVVDGSVSSVESSSDESSVNAVGLFVALVDISDVNDVVNSSSVVESMKSTVVLSKVDTAVIPVVGCVVVGSSVTPVVDGSVSSVESSSDESSVNAVGLFVTLVDISDVNGVVNSSSVRFTVVSSKVDTAIVLVDDCAVVGSSVTPVVDGSVSSVETSSDESSVNAVGLFVTLVDISDVNGVVNSSSVTFTVVSSKVDTAIIIVDDCAVVGSSVTPVVDGSVSSVESSSDESSVNAVGLFVALVDISDVNDVVNSSSVVESMKSTVVLSKVDTAVIPVVGCVVVGSSVTPVVDGSVSSVESSSDESSVNAVGLFVILVDISDVNGVVNSSSVRFTVVSSKVDTAIVLVDDCAVVGSSVTPVVDGSVSSVETSSDESSVNAVGLFVTLVDISDVNGVVNSSSVVESVTFTVVSSKVDTATIIVDDCAVVGSSVTPVVDGSVSSVESSSDESSVVVVGLFVTLVDISDVNGVVNSSSVNFTVVSSKVDTATIIVDDCVVVGSSVTPVVDGSVSSVESSSDESSVNAVGLFVTLVDISDVNGVVNSSSVTFTVVSSKVDTAIALVDDCAVVGSSVTPVVDGSVSSVESSSEESSVNAVGLFVALVDISDVNDVVNSSSVVESVKSTVVSSKLDTAVIPVVGCVVVGSSVTPVVDGSVSSVESSSDESSVNAVGLFVTLVDISDVNGVVNSSSVRFTVVSSKVDTTIALVDDCAVVGSSVTPVVDGSVSSVESSSDESSVNAVGLFVALVDISDVNDAVNSSSVVESMKSTVVSSKLDTAVIPVVGCVVVGSSVTPVVDGSVSSVESSSDESSVNAVGLFVALVDISDVNDVVNSSSVVESMKSTVVSSKLDTAVIPVVGCVVVGSSVTPVVDGSVSSVESSSDESSVNAVGLFVTLVDISDVNGVVNSSSVVESVKSTVVSSKLDTAVIPVVGCVVVD